jgi:hypothetical protein
MDVTKLGRSFGVAVVLCALAALACAGSALAASGPIAGTVTNQSDQPLEGIEVCAVVPPGPIVASSEECEYTDAAGEYSIPGTGPGVKVRFYDPETEGTSYAPQWYPGVAHYEEATAPTEADIEAGIDAVMGPGAKFKGTVVDYSTSAPLTGITICPDPPAFHEAEEIRCTHPDGDGSFVLSGLAPGEYRIEFEPNEGVNYVKEVFGPITLNAGSVIETEARLKRGVEFKGTVYDTTTGEPVEWPSGGTQQGTVGVCGLSTSDGARVKCVSVDQHGEYALAGLPAGGYVLSFSEAEKEEGLELHPDGYVRQYWDHVPTYDEATWVIAGAGIVLEGYDASLTPGAEVWPGEEETPVTTGGSGELPGSGLPSLQTPLTLPTTPVTPIAKPKPKVKCKKGFRKVTKKGRARCVKIKVKPKKHHHPRKKVSHR